MQEMQESFCVINEISLMTVNNEHTAILSLIRTNTYHHHRHRHHRRRRRLHHLRHLVFPLMGLCQNLTHCFQQHQHPENGMFNL